MWCGQCLKYQAKECFRKGVIKRRMTRACPKFSFNTRQVSAPLLEEAIRISRLPRSKIMVVMALLDSELRLRPQELGLGMSAMYKFPLSKEETSKPQKPRKVFLISSPRKEEHALGISLIKKNKNSRPKVVTIMVPRKLFDQSKDEKLKLMYERIESATALMKPQKKFKFLLKTLKGMRRDLVQRMFTLNKVRIRAKGHSLEEVVRDLTKRYL